MKFGKTLYESIELLPKWYHKYCFPYKKWKKYIKTKKYSLEQLEDKLRYDIKKINYVKNCILNGGNIFKILHKDLFLDNFYVNIIKFMKLNSIAVKKMCKKINKNYNCDVFDLIYIDLQKFEFLNNKFIIDLEEKHKICNTHCNYCDDISKKKPTNTNRYIYCPICLTKIIPGIKYDLFARIGVYPMQ